MGDNPLEDLINELRELRIDHQRLEQANRILVRRINELTQREAENRSANDGYIVGDRVRILKPSCPSHNRPPNSTTDAKGTVTGINLPWVHIRTDSNINIQRHTKNIQNLATRNE